MNLSIIIGFISGITLCIGMRAIRKGNKISGFIQLVLTFLTPILTILFCQKKDDFVFGGTDWEFLVQTATVDKMNTPWIILALYILLLILTLYSISKNKKE